MMLFSHRHSRHTCHVRNRTRLAVLDAGGTAIHDDDIVLTAFVEALAAYGAPAPTRAASKRASCTSAGRVGDRASTCSVR
jgi:hypothetical protein